MIPIKINNVPEIIDQIFFGKWLFLLRRFPKKIPKLKNNHWKDAIKNGKNILLIPIIVLPTPIQKLSKESAKAKNKASFESIKLEESKSNDTLSSFKDWNSTKNPIKIKIEQPTIGIKCWGNIEVIKFPKNKANIVTKKETTNNIIFPNLEIEVFFIPYVIPIPRESILLETAKIIKFINIICKPPKI